MYSDALYWATSPKTDGRDYHLTLREETVLRKLIHYSRSNEKITYSNKLIGEHTFLKVDTIKKVIPILVKLGYIRSIVSTGKDSGNHFKRRTINIKWDRLEFVLSEIPKKEEFDNDKIPKPEVISEEKQVEVVAPIVQEKTVTEVIPIERTNSPTEKYNDNSAFKLTDDKIDWIIKMSENSENEVSEKAIKLLNDEELLHIFYGEDGIWNVKDNLYENKHLIRIEYNIGTRCKLTNANEKGDYIHIDQRRFNKVLKDNNTEFRYITIEMYELIKLSEVQRLKLKTA